MGEEKPSMDTYFYLSPQDTEVHTGGKAGFIATLDMNFIESYVSDFLDNLEECI